MRVLRRSPAALGDIDGDGTNDVAVGSRKSEGNSTQGSIWILFLEPNGSVQAHQKINDIVGGFEGDLDQGDRFGESLSCLGDLDGDGSPELAAGAPGDDDGGESRGAVWILSLNPDGTVFDQTKVSSTTGLPPSALDDVDVFGSACATIGDLDGDGVPDLAVGAPNDGDGGFRFGAVWILFLNSDGTVKSTTKISSTEGDFGGALGPSYLFGQEISLLGDFDGNGTPDIAVSAPRDSAGCGGNPCGAVWMLFLRDDGSVKFHEKIDTTSSQLAGLITWDDGFAGPVAKIGDLDGDGVADLIVGAPNDDDGGPHESNSGAIWVLFLLEGTWNDLEGGVAGLAGEPSLAADGALEAGNAVTFSLSNARPFALSYLVLGLTQLSAPFKGGILVPMPDFLLPVVVDGFGEVTFAFPWPTGVPSGVGTYYQFWIQDAAGTGWLGCLKRTLRNHPVALRDAPGSLVAWYRVSFCAGLAAPSSSEGSMARRSCGARVVQWSTLASGATHASLTNGHVLPPAYLELPRDPVSHAPLRLRLRMSTAEMTICHLLGSGLRASRLLANLTGDRLAPCEHRWPHTLSA